MTCVRTPLAALALLPLLTGGCLHPEIDDYGGVCVTAEQDGDQHRLVVVADSHDCASDHKGASFECSISVDGFVAHVQTVFQDGKDPDHACANSIVTSCEVAVEPGVYTIEFADEKPEQLEVPGDQQVCLAGGVSDGETG
jgi:hypothetical protein